MDCVASISVSFHDDCAECHLNVNCSLFHRNWSALRNRRKFTKGRTMPIYQRVRKDDPGREARHRRSLQEGMCMWSELERDVKFLAYLLMADIFHLRSTRASPTIANRRRKPASGRSATIVRQILEFACQWEAHGTQLNTRNVNGDDHLCTNSAWAIHKALDAGQLGSFCKWCL